MDWLNDQHIVVAYLSEQYNTELLGTIICFSQTVLQLILVTVDITNARRRTSN